MQVNGVDYPYIALLSLFPLLHIYEWPVAPGGLGGTHATI